VFPGVDVAGGISYFLWDKKHKADCTITNNVKDESFSSTRPLNEFHILVRHSRSLPIIHKVQNIEKGVYLDKVISARKPFGIPSNYKPKSSGTPCWFTQRIGRQFVQTELVRDDLKLKDKWKVLIPFAPIAGQTDFSKPIKFYHSQNVKIAKPGEVCTETYLVAHAFDTEKEALNFKGYLFTKLFRFLLLQNVISQNITRGCFYFVPELSNYNSEITDDVLKNKWGITNEEWEFISQKIQDTE
jgi:site-specific DNA-methyltransferase (adenine-specific)